jgi:tRNA/rRNA methyltransferase
MTEAEPAIILVEPQLPENIGTAARAMANFGLGRLRLVNPREGLPHARATAAASGADHVLAAAETFASLEQAIADLKFVFATTARGREMAKAVRGPDEAVARLRSLANAGQATGVLFGRERIGLTNDEVSLANEILTLPIDPRHASLNIAQAVLIVAYEWRRSGLAGASGLPFAEEAREPADRVEIVRLFEHLENALDNAGFFRPVERRSHMVSSLRALLQRANLSEQEVRTLRGAVAALEGRPTRPHRSKDGTMSTEREREE